VKAARATLPLAVFLCLTGANPGQADAPPIAARQTAELETQLTAHIKVLANDIGERNHRRPKALARAAHYIESQWKTMGYAVIRQTYVHDGQSFTNLAVERPGTKTPGEIVIIGAHYDTAWNTPGANDNGSGVAALLALSQRFVNITPGRTLRFVAFTNEEPPHFQTEAMGSLVYARRSKAKGENIVAMLSLETMGYYVDGDDTQHYPFPLSLFYPDRGNFVAFVGNMESRSLVNRVKDGFERHARFPAEGASLPGGLEGVGWSDHWSFWQVGYQGVMVTDTAPFRYRHYHEPTDTAEKIDYPRFAQVVEGLNLVITDLVDGR